MIIMQLCGQFCFNQESNIICTLGSYQDWPLEDWFTSICMYEEFCMRKQGPVFSSSSSPSSSSSSSLKLSWSEEKKKRRRQDKVQKNFFACQHRQRSKVVHEGPRKRKTQKIKKKYVLIREMQKKHQPWSQTKLGCRKIQEVR